MVITLWRIFLFNTRMRKLIYSLALKFLIFAPYSSVGQELSLGKLDSNDTIIHHKYMLICYDTKAKLSHYTSYYLTKDRMNYSVERYCCFHPDSSIIDNTITLESFKLDKYDEGHYSSAEDFRFNELAEYNSFGFDNIAPQYFNMNRGSWKQLENQVREIIKTTDTVKVISGVIWDDRSLMTPCLKSKKKTPCIPIPIPDFFWKIICTKNECKYYLFPNTECDKSYQEYEINESDFYNYLHNK